MQIVCFSLEYSTTLSQKRGNVADRFKKSMTSKANKCLRSASSPRISHPLIGASDKSRNIPNPPIIFCLQLASFIQFSLSFRELTSCFGTKSKIMLAVYFAFFAIISSVSAAPSRQKSYPSAYAWPFGAFAGFGFPFAPPYHAPFYFPVFDFSQTPWYKGPNVCETKKVMDEPEEMKEWLSEGFSDSSSSYKHESESCRGNNDKYVCMKRVQTNDGSKMEMKKYECCYGFVRPMDGRSGCVENPEQSTSTSTAPTPVKMDDQMRYNYFKSSSKSRSGVDSVPAQ